MKHILYTDDDADAPNSVKDHNGNVCLAQCKVCGLAESQLEDYPECQVFAEDDIFEQPKPDEFKTESPLRAFTDFNADGEYAIGKGFRPSVQHLPKYLTAIREKEGWKLLQVMYADDPDRRSMVFERVGHRIGPAAQANRIEDIDPEHLKAAFPMVAVPSDEPSDDPVNPKHYAGTACAEIGERLTPNGYQILKYCWRLGEKDDPVIELGKALWYLDREASLGTPSRRHAKRLMDREFVEARTDGKSVFVRKVAMALWNMSQGGVSKIIFQDEVTYLMKYLEHERARYQS